MGSVHMHDYGGRQFTMGSAEILFSAQQLLFGRFISFGISFIALHYIVFLTRALRPR